MQNSPKEGVVIFGVGKISDVVFDYFSRDGDLAVAGFTCDRDYLPGPQHRGLPCVAFDAVSERFPPHRYAMHVAIGYHEVNRVRERVFHAARDAGYELASFVSSRSWPGRSLACGENCFIADGVSVEPCAVVGENVALWSNVVVGHHARIGDHCWLAAGTVVGGGAIFEPRCFAALNVTVGNEVTVGADTIMGARTLVTKCLPAKSVVIERDTERFRLDSTQFLRISKLK